MANDSRGDGSCPRCGGETEVDEVDIGVGMQQCGPRGCPACHWVEGDPALWPPDPEAGYDPDEDRGLRTFDTSDVVESEPSDLDGVRW